MIKIIYEIRGGDEDATFASKISGYKLCGEQVSLYDAQCKLFYKGQFLQNACILKEILDCALDDSKLAIVRGESRFFKE